MPWPAMPRRARERLDRLIAAGLLSDSEIGRRLGYSHTTVWRRRQLLMGDDGEKSRSHLAPGESYVAGPSGVFRCPDCGGKICIIPCRLCKIRRHLQSDRAARQLGFIADLPPEKSRAIKQQALFR